MSVAEVVIDVVTAIVVVLAMLAGCVIVFYAIPFLF